MIIFSEIIPVYYVSEITESDPVVITNIKTNNVYLNQHRPLFNKSIIHHINGNTLD